jgi:hypothetical protein
MAKAVVPADRTYADKTYADRFAIKMGNTPFTPRHWPTPVTVLYEAIRIHATGRNIWATVQELADSVEGFSSADTRGAIAWLRGRDRPARFLQPGSHHAMDCREIVLDRLDPEDAAWVLARERLDTAPARVAQEERQRREARWRSVEAGQRVRDADISARRAENARAAKVRLAAMAKARVALGEQFLQTVGARISAAAQRQYGTVAKIDVTLNIAHGCGEFAFALFVDDEEVDSQMLLSAVGGRLVDDRVVVTTTEAAAIVAACNDCGVAH